VAIPGCQFIKEIRQAISIRYASIVVGEDGPGHGHEMKRSLMEEEDGLNCGVGIYRGYIELRR
jgi:hypothetical protein